MTKIKPPEKSQLSDYYQTYYHYLGSDDLLTELKNQFRESLEAFSRFLESDGAPAYAPGKWTVKQLLGHLIDCERIFQYRALVCARGDENSVPGFDENLYVENGLFDGRALHELLEEWSALRRTYEQLLSTLSPEAWDRKGTANNREVSNRIILYFVVVHARHHTRILQARYGRG